MMLAEMDNRSNMNEENNNQSYDDASRKLNQHMQMIFVDQKLTKTQYAQLYSTIFNFCVRGKEVMVWTRNREFHNPNLDGTVQLLGVIDQFLNDHLKKISLNTPDTDEECLDYYYREWNRFQLSSKTLNNLCKYLNEQQHKRSATSKTVKELALHVWSEHLFKSLNKKVSSAALRMLDRNREGELINSSAIKAVYKSYLELGSLDNPNEFHDGNQSTVYKAFEQRILDGTQEYYNNVGETAMQKFYHDEKSFVDYLKHVQTRLRDEMKIATLLHPTTQTALMRICYDSLILKHEDVFGAEFKDTLTADKRKDMELICSLAVHCETVIKRLNKIFEEYVLQQGLDEIEKCVNETVKDPKKYIDTIIAVYEKFHSIVDQQFKRELGFSAALDKACASFINQNRLTTITKNVNKSAEYLAAYCHMILKKSNKNLEEAELDKTLNQLMIVFRFIEDKDVFEGFYKKRLAERLINELSNSDDAEALMISKLKQALGYDYTNKLQKMYQDIEVSKDLSEKFRKKNFSNSDNVEFRIKVLSYGSWPLRYDQEKTFNLPAELMSPIDRFRAFYASQHSSRKLIWLHRISKGEVAIQGMRLPYKVKMNALQLTALLQFNERSTFTVQQLQENTGIEMDYLKQMIESSLIKCKILKRSDQNNLTESSIIEFNADFKEPKVRFDISTKLDSERKAEMNETQRRIEDSRKFIIEAAIVRIMKMRKVLGHHNLIGEVLTQVSKQFHPAVAAIKKCIDALIEKEYLERKDGEKDTYQYLA